MGNELGFLICFVFFFQAEDGIRDLVRSRGLGDVYKRQEEDPGGPDADPRIGHPEQGHDRRSPQAGWSGRVPVSYTHLTLPTSDLV